MTVMLLPQSSIFRVCARALAAALLLAGELLACAAAQSVQGKQTVPNATTPPAPADSHLSYPQLVDITSSTGIHFDHVSTPEEKFINESMSGGVALIDYDRDGWPDIYFTNSPSVEMALAGKKARSALYRNNHDGTFT